MDIRCRRCAEPWDHDTIHEEVEERAAQGEHADYHTVAAEFRAKGCAAFRAFMGRPEDWRCERQRTATTEAAGALYDLLGDDMDGAAAMLEDFALD